VNNKNRPPWFTISEKVCLVIAAGILAFIFLSGARSTAVGWFIWLIVAIVITRLYRLWRFAEARAARLDDEKTGGREGEN